MKMKIIWKVTVAGNGYENNIHVHAIIFFSHEIIFRVDATVLCPMFPKYG